MDTATAAAPPAPAPSAAPPAAPAPATPVPVVPGPAQAQERPANVFDLGDVVKIWGNSRVEWRIIALNIQPGAPKVRVAGWEGDKYVEHDVPIFMLARVGA